MQFTFIHAADLHLDSPFKGVSASATEHRDIVDTLHAATWSAFDNLVALCQQEQAAFLLLAGDVYDGADRSLRAQLRLRDRLAQLGEAGTHTFWVHGNHDPSDSHQSSIGWPDMVHRFDSDTPETRLATHEGAPIAEITGASHRSRSERRNLAAKMSPGDHDVPQIALLHANVGATSNHANYAPCKLSDLREAGFDYWALGHVHEHAVLATNPHVIYPGSLQGLSVREPGPRGCVVATVDTETRRVETRFVPLDSVRWAVIDIPLNEIETIDALEQDLQAAIDGELTAAKGRPIIVRARLTGESDMWRELQDAHEMEGILEQLREWTVALAPWAWVQDLRVVCRPPIDLGQVMKGNDLLGQALSVGLRFRELQEAERASELSTILAPLFQHVRAKRVLAPLSEQDLQAVIERAENECVRLLDSREAAN
ncbi:MAG: DNA repair exonuclease [Lentisphaerae bacterium]|jgi:DNA repair protein SbcD/Mre11|nr:DNA repair exonuclease [Lentisphaerota bacterium]MBT4821111.1 DNA repair exonuclease [Lentisphaerota bacterium]MBT5604983.1 DNA repair exonuclease [Lentisphaerota bacterium]MBT7055407.1 DNA repair exonuclease [Lentisphaerota bacterium]MBT7847755.1 DNA repair exonuclease [Lentisphaerota bacterium]